MSTDQADQAEFVDLTDSPCPAETAKQPTRAAKRPRDEPEQIDLVSREDIMAFAAAKNTPKKRSAGPLSDSTGQVGNSQPALSGRPDNLWLKHLHMSRVARRGEPTSVEEAAGRQPKETAQGSEAGPSGRQTSEPQRGGEQRGRVTLITWNVW